MNEIKSKLSKIFYSTSDKVLDEIIMSCKIQKFDSKSHIFLENNICSSLYIFISGKVSLYKVDLKNEQRTIFIVGKECVLNEEIIVGDLTATNCEVLEYTECVVISKDKLLELCTMYPELMFEFMRISSLKTKKLLRQIKNSSTYINLDNKVRCKLWKLAHDYGVEVDGGILIDYNITVTEISKLVGAKRETVSRTISSIINEGDIKCNNGHYTILNIENFISKCNN